MSDDLLGCSCVVDCSGLHEIARTNSDNLKSLYLDHLRKGVIAVPACVWKEFKELYDDEADALEPYISIKIKLKKAYLVGAARIADRLNSGFSRGPYDSLTDLYTASIATVEQYRLLTSSSQLKYYKAMDYEVSDLATWADGPDITKEKMLG